MGVEYAISLHWETQYHDKINSIRNIVHELGNFVWTLHEEGRHEDQYEGSTTTNKEDYNEKVCV